MDCPHLMEHAELETGQSRRSPGDEPIPGYRLLALLGRGGFGEVWKCEAPGRLCKAIKFVYGNLQGLEGASAEEELRAIGHVKDIRHPFMLSMERVEIIDGELLIVTELADKSLHDVFAAYQQAGAAGIPRDELLAYLREAAEALDLLNIQYGLQHLDIKPQNLFLVSSHVKVADFGLVSSLGGRPGEGAVSLSAITPLYAPPEVFRGSLSAHCDQYSLAIVYQELLTGKPPFRGENLRQLLLQHTTAEPNLKSLPAPDRPVVAKALCKDPDGRFSTCTDFVLALATSHGSPTSLAQAGADSFGMDGFSRTAAQGERKLGSSSSIGRSETFLPGYRFLECIGCSPQAEIWIALAPGDKARQVKFLFGLNSTDKNREAEAIAWLNALSYPTLAYLKLIPLGPARLVVVTDWAELSLWKRYQQCQSQGLTGIPRVELLGRLRTAAETLDYLYEQHAIQHLGLNPRNLLLNGEALAIEGFGLMQVLYLPAGQPIPQAQKSYSAPELLRGNLSRACDQYSLALIYFDLVCGAGPRRSEGKPLLVAKRDLSLLPEPERGIVSRALCEDAHKRWPSATEFIRALQEAGAAPVKSTVNPASGETAGTANAAGAGEGLSPDEIISGLVATALKPNSAAPAVDNEAMACAGEFLLRKFSAPLPLGTARQRLEEFAQQCGAQVIRQDEEDLVLHIIRPRSFWQQCLGRQPGLELRIHLARPRLPAATPIEVTLQIATFDCRRKHGAQLLKELGLLLLESVRTALQVTAERRIEDRLVWQQTLPVRSILGDGTLGEVIDCKGKDISVNGIGFYLPRPLPTTLVSIDVPTNSEPSTLTVQANIVRVQRCGNGWYEVGALFLKKTEDQSVPA